VCGAVRGRETVRQSGAGGLRSADGADHLADDRLRAAGDLADGGGTRSHRGSDHLPLRRGARGGERRSAPARNGAAGFLLGLRPARRRALRAAMLVLLSPRPASLFVPALFTHLYDPSVPIFRVAILLTPFAALPLDGVLRAMGHTRYLFRIFFWRLLLTVAAVLLGLKLFGMVGAISGHAIAESAIRVAMLDRVRRELEVSWKEVLP